MNIIGQIDPSAFACSPRMHHGEPALESPSSEGLRRRNLLALKAQNWRVGGSPTPPAPWDYEVEYVQSIGPYYVNTGLNGSDAGGSIVVDAKIGAANTSGRVFYWGYNSNFNTYFERNGSRIGTNPVLTEASDYITSGMTRVVWHQTPSGIETDIYHGEGIHLTNSSYAGMPSGEITLFSIGGYGSGSSLRLGRVSISLGGTKRAEMVPCIIDGTLCFYDIVRERQFNLGGYFMPGPRI